MPILTGTWLLKDELSEHFTHLSELQSKEAKSSQELSNEIIDMVRNNAKRIEVQVREMADCVKGLSNPPQFNPCQVLDIANQVTETLGFQAKEKSITLKTEGLEDLPPLQADGSRLFKAFYNLINNAIPEVMKEGSITVRGITDPDASTILISVIDTGQGMTPEVHDSLFTQHAVSRKAGGTGLGTKIVKDAIDSHGGQITVESELGVGTTFHIRLPIGGPTVSSDSLF